ncbi:GerMN domain-containing protein [Clostridium sp. SHJSY1]|uniref:GerMN domain-containing protein n=1 Tax=Clostridium sp. SHJSY1 TaxID=2942483 RepID=UPI0028740765|nr:GerMN domain-containing protein [Clostridium sp. SHJSY1]MDS0524829.1 GerMN domain-containing protein [Clostridium sp. SHJSY1]
MLLAKDYFPIVLNSKYIYEGTGDKLVNFTRFTDYTNNKKQQFRIDTGKNEIINIYKSTILGVKLIFTEDEIHYRENFLGKTPNKQDYILLNPITTGRRWTLSDGSNRTITNVDIPLQTSYKTFPSVIEVTTINGKNKTIDYYAKDTGLVKTSFYSDNILIASSTLKEIKENVSLTQKIRFFYPNDKINGISYIDKNINFFTNDSTKIKFENEFQEYTKNFAPCIGSKTGINYVYFNDIDYMVYIDFSHNFVNDLGINSKYEYLSLISITNSMGKYYNESKVYITVDGNPYSSHYIQKQPREPFLTDFNNINEIILP